MALTTACDVPLAGFVSTDIWFNGGTSLPPATTQIRYERRV